MHVAIMSSKPVRRALGACLLACATLALPWPTHARPTAIAATSATGANAASTQSVDGAQLEACARTAAAAWLTTRQVRFDIEPGVGAAALAVPTGHVELLARPIDDGQAVGARLQVWVDVNVDGRFVRSQPVTLKVHAYRHAWVATEDVDVGRDVPAAPFESREVDIAAARAQPVDGPLPAARLRRRVMKGELLTAAHLERRPAVQRGGNVTLRARLGDIGIESRGEALQDGEPGQHIWVKVATSTGPVLALIVREGLVEMQP